MNNVQNYKITMCFWGVLIFWGLSSVITVYANKNISVKEDYLFCNNVIERLECMRTEEKESMGSEALVRLKALDIRKNDNLAIALIEVLAQLKYKKAEPFLLEILSKKYLSKINEMEVRVKAASALIQFGSEKSFEEAVHYVNIVDEWYRLHSFTVEQNSRLPSCMSESVAWSSHDERMIPKLLFYICRGTGHDKITTSILYEKMKQGDYSEEQIRKITDIVFESMNECLVPDCMNYGTFTTLQILFYNWDILDATQKDGTQKQISQELEFWTSNLDEKKLLEGKEADMVKELREMQKIIKAMRE